MRGQVLGLRHRSLAARIFAEIQPHSLVIRVTVGCERAPDRPRGERRLEMSIPQARVGGVVHAAVHERRAVVASQEPQMIWSSANGNGISSQKTSGATSMTGPVQELPDAG